MYVHVHMFVYVHVYMRICVYAHMYVFIYVDEYMCIWMCMCITTETFTVGKKLHMQAPVGENQAEHASSS